MTTIDERYNALKNVKHFLYRLMDPKRTPRVPAKIRKEARDRLRHFPFDFQIDKMKDYELVLDKVRKELEQHEQSISG